MKMLEGWEEVGENMGPQQLHYHNAQKSGSYWILPEKYEPSEYVMRDFPTLEPGRINLCSRGALNAAYPVDTLEDALALYAVLVGSEV